MKNFILTSMICFAFVSISFSQEKSVVITPNVGLGFADGTSCLAFGANIGYQFNTNRISLCYLSGSKKRTEYSNGDFADALIGNITLTYSKIFNNGKVSFVPDLGLGYVSGSWTENSDGNGKNLQSGFGLTFGCGIEFSLTDNLLFKLSYDHALLITDFSGNGAILCGVGFQL